MTKTSSKADQAGITSAILCTIHCIVVPVLFLVTSSWSSGQTYHLPAWWALLDYVFLLVSFAAVYHSAKHTTSCNIKTFLWLSWLLLAVAIAFEAQLHWLAYIASAALVTTHFFNIRRLKRRQPYPEKAKSAQHL